MLAGLLLFATIVMKLFPETPFARALHRMLVEVPLDRTGRMGRRHLIFAVAAMVVLFTSAELIALLGSADLALAMAWDVSLYVDAAIAAWTIAAVSRGKGAWTYAKTRIAGLARRMARPRAPRRNRRAAATPPVNDLEDDPGGFALAA